MGFERGTCKISGTQNLLLYITGYRFIRFVVYFNKMRAEKNPVALGMIAHYCYENYFNAISKIIIYKSNTSFSSMLEKNASTLKFKLMIMSSFIYNQSSPMS